MKKSELKQIIREEYQTVTGKPISMLTEESIITKILYMFLGPKVKKDINKLKKTPELQDLEQQAKIAVKELEAISNKLDRAYERRKQYAAQFKDLGIDIDPWSSPEEFLENLRKARKGKK